MCAFLFNKTLQFLANELEGVSESHVAYEQNTNECLQFVWDVLIAESKIHDTRKNTLQ